MKYFAAIFMAFGLASAGAAEDAAITFDYEGTFEDAAFAVEDAIVSKGLVIDYRSHTGEMLERTKGDVGSDVTLFDAADVFLFCSAVVSRQVMEADPMNIVFCPYDIFVATLAGKEDETIIGYRSFPDGPMKEVEVLLDSIVQSAIGE